MFQPVSLSTHQLCKIKPIFRKNTADDKSESADLVLSSNNNSNYEEEKLKLLKMSLIALGCFGATITLCQGINTIVKQAEFNARKELAKNKKLELKTFDEFQSLAQEIKVPVLEKCKSLNETLRGILQVQADLKIADQELIDKTGAKRINRLILNGKPGTGKSFFAKIYAKTIGADYLQVNYADINSKWAGESVEKMKAVFDYAMKMGQKEPKKDFVLVFNEIDSIIQPIEKYSNSSSGGTYWIGKIEQRAAFLEFIENLAEKAPNVTVIGTTNLAPEKRTLDGAALSRFQNIYEVPLPTKNILHEALKMNLQIGNEYREFAESNDASLAKLAQTMESKGFSFRDLDNVIETSKRHYFRDAMKDKNAKFNIKYLNKAIEEHKLTDGTTS